MARCFPFLSLTSFSSRCHKNAALIAHAGAFADGGFPLLLLLARGLLGPPTAEHPRLHSPAPRALSLSDSACPPPCLLLEEEPSSSLPLPLRRESQQLNGDIRRKAEGAQALRLRPSPAPSSWLSGHRSTPTPLHHLSFPSSFLGPPRPFSPRFLPPFFKSSVPAVGCSWWAIRCDGSRGATLVMNQRHTV